MCLYACLVSPYLNTPNLYTMLLKMACMRIARTTPSSMGWLWGEWQSLPMISQWSDEWSLILVMSNVFTTAHDTSIITVLPFHFVTLLTLVDTIPPDTILNVGTPSNSAALLMLTAPLNDTTRAIRSGINHIAVQCILILHCTTILGIV